MNGILTILSLIAIILPLVAWREVAITRNRNKEIHDSDQVWLTSQGFNIDNKVVFEDVALYVDNYNRCNAIKKSKSSSVEIHDFDDLFDVEFIDNGDGGTRGSLGGAIAGGILLGGFGAVAGMSANTSGKCNLLQVRLSVNDVRCPQIICDFLKILGSVERKSSTYQNAFKAAKDFCGLLSYVLNNRKRK